MPMNPRLLRPTASGFNPKSISGLQAWYAADVASSITIETGVQQWSDLSGNGRHLIQNTTNNQPAHNSVSVNGKPTVTFDGTNDRMATTATFSIPLPTSVFIVFRFEADYVSGQPRVASHGGVGARMGEMFRNEQNDFRTFGQGTTTPVSRMRFRKNVVDVNLATEPRIDIPAGQIQEFNVWDFEFGTTDGNPIAIVELAQLQNGSFGNVSVAEYLLFDRFLPVADADRVRQYLGRKYNLAFQA